MERPYIFEAKFLFKFKSIPKELTQMQLLNEE
jgi:hypothetical protein